MSSSIQTTVVATEISVTPVKFRWYSDKGFWVVTQTLEFTGWDGHKYSIDIHLQEGCSVLLAGEPMAYPPVAETTGESA